MRQLKFRAWDKKNKRFGLQGFSILGECTVFDLVEQYRLENLLEDLDITQYTGMNDRNGQEIYEGDVVRFVTNTEEHIAKVFYSELEGVMYPTHEGRCVLEDNAVVIGNIFENPEILQKQ